MERVCVTGAGGYIASWLVKFLLQKGYMVHGTVRNPCSVPFPGSITNPEVQIIEPAVIGTQNVLNACSNVNIKRVVLVSSCAAVIYNPNWPKDQAMDEECWSDLEFCKSVNSHYFFAKTKAEKEALGYTKRAGLNMVTVLPSLKTRALVDQLKSMYPDHNFPKSFSEVEDNLKLSSRKLQSLGWSYKSLEQTIADSVRNYQEHGLL